MNECKAERMGGIFQMMRLKEMNFQEKEKKEAKKVRMRIKKKLYTTYIRSFHYVSSLDLKCFGLLGMK